jgi:hypothetical protein
VRWRQVETSDRVATEVNRRGTQRRVLGEVRSQKVERRGERAWWSGRAAVEMVWWLSSQLVASLRPVQ